MCLAFLKSDGWVSLGQKLFGGKAEKKRMRPVGQPIRPDFPGFLGITGGAIGKRKTR
jgi:hypothetical protein